MSNVPTLLNLLQPHKDELIWSYMNRLSQYNGISNTNSFIIALQNNISNINFNNIYQNHYNYEGLGLFGPLFQNINADMQEHIIQECSLYPYQRMFMTPMDQAKTVYLLFNNIINSKQINKYNVSQKIIYKTAYCEKCREEDLNKYGYTYLRRSHQLPGVSICYKHHTQLFYVDNNTPVTVFKIYKKMLPPDYKSTLSSFATFSSGLLETKSQINLWLLQYSLLKYILGNRYQDLSLNVYLFPFYHPPLYISPKRSLFLVNTFILNKFFQNTEKLDNYINRFDNFNMFRNCHISDYLQDTSYFEFKDPEFLEQYRDLIRNIQIYYDSTRDFFIQAKNDYDIFQPFNMTILRMRHKACGTIFYTTPIGFLSGLKCPNCVL